eukprot:TRINITY_DN4764_c0_g1_i2.p1 TRINITY_DN4764_c0_g1~~TRINITY_DN4764_c0_g1_i2.p1  ORF type:complete len:453 (-),score=95.50 TRINITY_DN4764_c0_g1_i2:40-1305(-)
MLRHKETPTSVLAAINIFGGIIFGYNTGNLNLSQDPMCLDYLECNKTDGITQTLFTTTLLLGATFGSLIGGVICDKYGRKIGMGVGSIIVICAAACNAIAPFYYLNLAVRVLLGFGVGLIGVVCPMYVHEMSNDRVASSLGTIFQMAVTIGISLAYGAGMAILLLIDSSLYSLQWKLQIGTGVIPAIVLLFISLRVPESTVWELNEDNTDTVSYGELFKGQNLGNMITGVVLAACLQLTGINIVMFQGSQILEKVPAIAANDTLKYGALLGIGIWNSLTTLTAVFLIDKVGSKTLLMVGTLLCVIADFALGFTFIEGLLPDDTQIITVLVAIAIYLVGFEAGIGCLFWVFANTLFDDDVREKASSIINATQWFFNLAINTTFPLMIKNLKETATFWIYGGIGILTLVYLFIKLPSDKKKSH